MKIAYLPRAYARATGMRHTPCTMRYVMSGTWQVPPQAILCAAAQAAALRRFLAPILVRKLETWCMTVR